MNKEVFVVATAVLFLALLSPLAGAVSISYEADSGGESVSINENYDVDSTVTVKESMDISFGNLQVDQERTAEGTGEADLEQTISGKSVDGTGYVAENDILSDGTINARTSTSATANTLGVDQTVSATGDAELYLAGEEGANMVGQHAYVGNGRLNSKQTLDIGNSVRTSLDASIWGDSGAAEMVAEDADGNWAWTEVKMTDGELNTEQGAEADGSATADQVSDVDAVWGRAVSAAVDADGNWALTEVQMGDGELSTVQGAEADGSAAAVQDSYIEGDFSWAICEAENADGRVRVDNEVVGNGVLDFEGVTLATDDDVMAEQLSYAEGNFIIPWTEAWNQYGITLIENGVNGTLFSVSGAIANEDVALSGLYMDATGTSIYRFVEAENDVVPDYDSDTIELEDGTVTREEISIAEVNKASAVVAVIEP